MQQLPSKIGKTMEIWVDVLKNGISWGEMDQTCCFFLIATIGPMLFLDLFFHQWGPPLTSAATEAQAVMHFRIGFSQQIFLRFAAVKTCGEMAESGNSSHWGNGG
jgi:hypothetical protein